MEANTDSENPFCLGCLCSSNERKIQEYKIQYPRFWAVFEVGTMKLCFLCKRMAQQAEIFIHNVQSNQILLNCLGDLSTTIKEARSQFQPHLNLALTPLDTDYVDGNDFNLTTENYFKVTSINSKGTIKNSKGTSKNSKGTIKNSKGTIKNPKGTGKDSISTRTNDPMLICSDRDETLSENVEERRRSFNNINVMDIKLNSTRNDTDINDEPKDIKLELKEEDIVLDHLEGEFINQNDEFQDSFIKEEDDFPLKMFLKKEKSIEGIEFKGLHRSHRKKEAKKKGTRKTIITKNLKKLKEHFNNEAFGIKMISITEEECMEERKQLALDQKYLNCTYKCEDCLKGFNFKDSYNAHLKRHSALIGAFQCEICKLRMETEEKLTNHKRYHTVRYKCIECGLVRISRATIKDHYSAYHLQGEKQYPCPYCSKAFKRQVSQRKHIRYTHTVSKKDRVTCDFCHKTYKTKHILKTHMMQCHPKEVSAPEPIRAYACEECGMAFKTPSRLKNHSVKHLVTRDYYCVECDKAFKSEAALKQHLKTAQPHVNYMELPLPCLLCEKKFAIKRDLDRHMNSVHLDVKPYKCDKCNKAYVNNWSLIDHKRHAHEGYKRPLKYPCKFCNKIFDRNSILKAHIRTHTGERPYQCSKCPAQFSQSGVLATHDKLIHLRLTRDGRPKHNGK